MMIFYEMDVNSIKQSSSNSKLSSDLSGVRSSIPVYAVNFRKESFLNDMDYLPFFVSKGFYSSDYFSEENLLERFNVYLLIFSQR